MRSNDLKRLDHDDDARSRALAAALAEEAESRGLLDVALAAVGSPIGELLIAVTRRGLVRVAFENEDRDEVLAELASDVSPRILESAMATQAWRRQFDEYFDGSRQRFDLRVDRRLIHGLQREVLTATRWVPYGTVSTYGKIAQRIGRPTAARAVGRALGANPIPVVIPCHRIVGASGALTGYAGGLERKVSLLQLEGALLAE